MMAELRFATWVAAGALLLLLLQPSPIVVAQWYPPQWYPPQWQGSWVPSPGIYGPPSLNVSCDRVDCGQGKCVTFSNSTQSSNGSSYSYSYSYGFGCECEPGWNKFHRNFSYLPCVLPNCTFSTSCPQNFTSSVTPPQRLDPLHLDPCSWAICGEGKCTSTTNFTYTCDCNPGFTNLLNITSLPCYRSCPSGPGSDCERLGIGMGRSSVSAGGNGSSSTTGGSSDDNKAPVKFLGLLILMVSLIVA